MCLHGTSVVHTVWWQFTNNMVTSVNYGSANQTNSAFHPYGVGKWVLIHVITWNTAVEIITSRTRAVYGCLVAGQSLWVQAYLWPIRMYACSVSVTQKRKISMCMKWRQADSTNQSAIAASRSSLIARRTSARCLSVVILKNHSLLVSCKLLAGYMCQMFSRSGSEDIQQCLPRQSLQKQVQTDPNNLRINNKHKSHRLKKWLNSCVKSTRSQSSLFADNNSLKIRKYYTNLYTNPNRKCYLQVRVFK